MTLKDKKRLRDNFFTRAGPNARAFAALFEKAGDLGFYDQSHFSRLFAANRGISPSAYRHRHHLGAATKPTA